jgi:hypothetical protein
MDASACRPVRKAGIASVMLYKALLTSTILHWGQTRASCFFALWELAQPTRSAMAPTPRVVGAPRAILLSLV